MKLDLLFMLYSFICIYPLLVLLCKGEWNISDIIIWWRGKIGRIGSVNLVWHVSILPLGHAIIHIMRSRGIKEAFRIKIMGEICIGGMHSWGSNLKIEVIVETQGTIPGIIGKGTNRMVIMDNTMKIHSMALKIHKRHLNPFAMNFSKANSVHMVKIVKGNINSFMNPYRKWGDSSSLDNFLNNTHAISQR